MNSIKITNKRYIIIGLFLSSIILLSACGNDSSGSTEDTKNKVHKVENTTGDKPEEKYAPLDILNQLATLSTQTEELYVTGNIVIGENEEVTPGIYDLEIT